jgi:hypothetical protein
VRALISLLGKAVSIGAPINQSLGMPTSARIAARLRAGFLILATLSGSCSDAAHGPSGANIPQAASAQGPNDATAPPHFRVPSYAGAWSSSEGGADAATEAMTDAPMASDASSATVATQEAGDAPAGGSLEAAARF